ncbi:MAG: 3-hydroxyanthranilate 3,4-dioxygenase [Deltaproteobacteria bacterium]|nr:3-hydroxyanthranilate 3,4-dioxygenase [Deltaproteobacteria bacterium]
MANPPPFSPLNFKKWIEEHRHLLKPPVGNQVVYEDTDLIIMVVGGPNIRSDYHVDPAEEFFYQLEGNMVLKCVDERQAGMDRFIDMPINEGEIYLLPANVPHSPQRFENTVGLVVERKRAEKDGLRWYCGSCGEVVYEETFHLDNIVKDMPPVFDRFFSTVENRTCSSCGWVHPERD